MKTTELEPLYELDIEIPVSSIVSSTDINRRYTEVSNKTDEKEKVFVFKNNKPDKVLMTYSFYKELQSYIEQLECFISVKNFENKENKEFYDVEDVIGNYL